jgi:putative endonuclease
MSGHSDAGKAGIVGSAAAAAQARGAQAEAFAEAFLARRGVTTLARRLRCRGGELDLICLDGCTLVFVEVRLRTPGRFGNAADSITATKQQRLLHAARWWLAGPGRCHAQRPMRFDAVLFDRLEPDQACWLRSAFDADAW